MPTDDKFTVEEFNERNGFGRETWVYAAVDEIKLLCAKVEALTAENERLREAHKAELSAHFLKIYGMVNSAKANMALKKYRSAFTDVHAISDYMASVDVSSADNARKTLDNPAPSPAQEG